MPRLSIVRRLARLLPLSIVLVLAGCSAGYQQIDGQWKYVTVDEGRGRLEHEIPNVDNPTLEPFKGSDFARDANQVYYQGKPLAGADAATFHHLRGVYWADARRVYYFSTPVSGADPDTFRFIQGFWARDASNIYYAADAVSPKDPASFTVVNANWARDALWYYPANGVRHLPIEVLDRGTFQVLKAGWAKDCCRVYYFDRVVKGADPATFEAINDVRGRDNAYYYLTGFPQRTVAEEAALQERRKGR